MKRRHTDEVAASSRTDETAASARDEAVASARSVAARVAALDWPRIVAELDAQGWATTGTVLDPDACRALAARYGDEAAFRSRVVMARHGFGKGEYKYFAYPLPAPVGELRTRLVSAPGRSRERVACGAGRGDEVSSVAGGVAAPLSPRRPAPADTTAAALRRG